jgi:hypothetical protein
MKNGKKECKGVSKIGTSHLIDIPVFKTFQSVEERIRWVGYPPIALHKVDQVFKYYITSLKGVATECNGMPPVVLPCTGSRHPLGTGYQT